MSFPGVLLTIPYYCSELIECPHDLFSAIAQAALTRQYNSKRYIDTVTLLSVPIRLNSLFGKGKLLALGRKHVGCTRFSDRISHCGRTRRHFTWCLNKIISYVALPRHSSVRQGKLLVTNRKESNGIPLLFLGEASTLSWFRKAQMTKVLESWLVIIFHIYGNKWNQK